MPPPASLVAARNDFASARATSRTRLQTVADRRSALERLRRDNAPSDADVVAAENDLSAAEQDLRKTRQDEQQAKQVVQQELASWLSGFLPDDLEEASELDAAYPIVMLPVKVQTRFVPVGAPTELLVRIYPDEIVADAHEPELTVAEQQAGHAYWEYAWDSDNEADAWRALLQRFPSSRAAWIVAATTPANVASRPAGTPAFPSVDLRPAAWTRPAEACVLPDRWLVIAYRGGQEVRRGLTGAVRDPLALSPDPAEDDPARLHDVSGDGLILDEDVLWMVDFAEAEAAGLAVRIPIDTTDAALGFDRILVVGVKASVEPDEGGELLAALFEGHRYGRGLAIVPQGTPTNNTAERRSGYPPADDGGSASFALERNAPALARDDDGPILATALGVGARLADELPHVPGADGGDQRAAAAMNAALWPVTLGYYLEQMLAPSFDRRTVDAVRDYFTRSVRGRGPYPAFRVGDVPYSVLPVSSLSRWVAIQAAKGPDAKLPPALLALRDLWRQRVDGVPRLRGADPGAELLEVLSMDASAREVRIRPVWGADLIGNLFQLYGYGFWGTSPPDWSAWVAQRQAVVQHVLVLLGSVGWTPAMKRPRIATAALGGGAFRFGYPFVTSIPVSDTARLHEEWPPQNLPAFVKTRNYVEWIAKAPWQQLRDIPNVELPTLLYLLLKHAMLRQYVGNAFDILIADGRATEADRREPELIGIPIGPAGTVRRPVWDVLATPAPSTDGAPLGDYLAKGKRPNTKETDRYRRAVALLAGLPTAELERLLTETLDVCSHRIDAWITSLAARRLETMRKANPDGCHIGGFGWLDEVRPLAPELVEERKLDGKKVYVQKVSGGHVHAPTLTHAATAAVLRSGYLNRGGEKNKPFALNLSSRRVRDALSLLDAVRQEQPLGAVLGYRFERGIHERSLAANVNLEKFITSFRSLYPLVPAVGGATGPMQPTAAGRNVADGLAVWRQWKKTNSLPQQLAPSPTAPERAELAKILGALDELLDAVADLLLADSVHQMVRGSVEGAAASVESMAAGNRPPEPEIAVTPRGGAPLMHRVALVLGDGGAVAPWPSTETPRSKAEPALDEWAGTILGDPASVKCRAAFPRSEPDPAKRNVRAVTFDELGLRPLDVLALATEAADGSNVGELERRIKDFVARENSSTDLAPDDVEVSYAADPKDPAFVRTVPELLEVARAVAHLIGGARPLAPKDLLPPQAVSLAEGATFPADARAANAKQTLASVLTDLENAIDNVEQDLAAGSRPKVKPLTDALADASLLGIVGAFPGERDAEQLLTRARSVLTELEDRDARAAAAGVDHDVVQAVFGRDFVFLPRFVPPAAAADELGRALAGGPSLVKTDPAAPRKWLQQAARVRAPLARLRRVALYAGTVGADATAFDIVQLPHDDGERWLGLPYGSTDPPHGRLSLLLHRPAKPAATGRWSGLLVDEWSELLPRRVEQTGIAFHYDDAGAEPPQAVLVAVPADPTQQTWSAADVVAVVEEALELAQMRGVELEALDELGQLVPAVVPAWNTENDAVDTDFLVMRRGDHTP